MKKISRNEKCKCGSGLRYKHCHGRLVRSHFSNLDDPLKSKKRQPKKPSGTSGAMRVGRSPDGTVLSQHLRIQWPTDQKKIEDMIIRMFVIKFEQQAIIFPKYRVRI